MCGKLKLKQRISNYLLDKDVNSIGGTILIIYAFLSSLIGIYVCFLGINVALALKNTDLQDSFVAFIFVRFIPYLFLMLFSFLLSIIVSIYQFVRKRKTFIISLIPLIIWFLSFICLVI